MFSTSTLALFTPSGRPDTALLPPVGMTVTAEVECTGVEGRKLTFSVKARDDKEVIAEGSHERFVIDAQRFMERMEAKKREFLSGSGKTG